jgi:hypothetical protein
MFKHHIFDNCFIYVALGTISYRIMTIYIYMDLNKVLQKFSIFIVCLNVFIIIISMKNNADFNLSMYTISVK